MGGWARSAENVGFVVPLFSRGGLLSFPSGRPSRGFGAALSRCGELDFRLGARLMYVQGQTFTHTPAQRGGVQTLTLPEIDESHIRDIRLEAGGVTFRGFHFLPR